MKRKSNLSEELYKMRKLMNFDSEKFREEKTSLDRLMEEKMVEKYLLSEQVTGQTADKMSEPMIPTEDESSVFGKIRIEGRISSHFSGEGMNEDEISTMVEEAKKRNSDLKSKYGEVYDKFIRALANYETNLNSGNVTIWYFWLTQQSREDFLEQFIGWVNTKKNRLVRKIYEKSDLCLDKKGCIEADLKKGKTSSEVIKKKIIPPKPPIDPFKFNMKGANTFIDNCSDITEGMQSRIDTFFNDITPKIKETLSKPKGKVLCEKIDVAASSSRFRNTDKGQCDASNLTWAQLSEQRANKVYEEIYKRLSELGVKFTNKHKVLRGGTNRDGTSGPNPGVNEDGVQYTISVDGTYRNTIKDPSDEQINEYGAPHPTKDEYDVHKFCTVEVFISGLIEPDVEPDVEIEVVRSRDYSMVLNVDIPLKGKARTRKFNPIKWVVQNTGTPTNRECELF
jgi:hypothetical protein